MSQKREEYYCYCVITTDNTGFYTSGRKGGGRMKKKCQRTYIGVTNNLKRRLRQHNGEIVGGAKTTRGRVWRYLFHVSGFDKIQALQFEWRMHHPKPRCKERGPAGRWTVLDRLMRTVKWLTLPAGPLTVTEFDEDGEIVEEYFIIKKGKC